MPTSRLLDGVLSMRTCDRLLHKLGSEPVSKLLRKSSVPNCSKLTFSHWKSQK